MLVLLSARAKVFSSPVPSPSFLALECAGSKKVGPGIHCLRMRYKNLMNLIIKSSRDANLRHIHVHTLTQYCSFSVGQALAFIQCR